MQTDDNSVMEKLMTELDLDSAITRLTRIGFVLHTAATRAPYQLTRTTVKGTEVLLIRMNEDKHFVVTLADFDHGEYSEVISSWDQWVDFVRMLIARLIFMARQKEQAKV